MVNQGLLAALAAIQLSALGLLLMVAPVVVAENLAGASHTADTALAMAAPIRLLVGFLHLQRMGMALAREVLAVAIIETRRAIRMKRKAAALNMAAAAAVHHAAQAQPIIQAQEAAHYSQVRVEGLVVLVMALTHSIQRTVGRMAQYQTGLAGALAFHKRHQRQVPLAL